MGIGALLRRLRGESVGRKASYAGRDHRNLERLNVHDRDLARLSVEDGSEGVVLEASYAAVAATVRTPRGGFASRDGRLRGTLRVLDQAVSCVLKPARSAYARGEPLSVFLVLHDGPESLLFLRDLLEPLRRGSTLRKVDRSIVKERYRDARWECLNGDGPTDVVLRDAEGGGGLEEALVVYLLGERYVEVAFLKDAHGGRIETRRSVDATGVGARMQATGEVDKASLRFAACILAGIEDDGIRRKLEPMRAACLRALGVSRAAEPAA